MNTNHTAAERPLPRRTLTVRQTVYIFPGSNIRDSGESEMKDSVLHVVETKKAVWAVNGEC
jgi:hypothetical protein